MHAGGEGRTKEAEVGPGGVGGCFRCGGGGWWWGEGLDVCPPLHTRMLLLDFPDLLMQCL